jgi:hypothetical protein
MSRRPKLDISAVNKVDAVPLRKALEIHQKALAELEKGRARQAALNKEIEDWMANTDPDDEKRIQLISGKKIQADIIPGMIRRNELQFVRELSPALLREADKFKSELRRFYEQANEAIAVQVAEVLRPYFCVRTTAINGEKRDRALELARQSDDCWAVYERLERLNRISVREETRPENFDAGTRYDRELAEAATALLMLAEEA